MQAVKAKLASLKAKLKESEDAANAAEAELNEITQKAEELETLVIISFFVCFLTNDFSG